MNLNPWTPEPATLTDTLICSKQNLGAVVVRLHCLLQPLLKHMSPLTLPTSKSGLHALPCHAALTSTCHIIGHTACSSVFPCKVEVGSRPVPCGHLGP